jgi:hypothetical protein
LIHQLSSVETCQNVEHLQKHGTVESCSRLFPRFGKILLLHSSLLTRDKFPTSIIYPSDYLPTVNQDQQAIIDLFVQDLEASLGLIHTKLSFKSLWDESPPEAAMGQGLEEFMKDVSESVLIQSS